MIYPSQSDGILHHISATRFGQTTASASTTVWIVLSPNGIITQPGQIDDFDLLEMPQSM
jgi:hypothetical protein